MPVFHELPTIRSLARLNLTHMERHGLVLQLLFPICHPRFDRFSSRMLNGQIKTKPDSELVARNPPQLSLRVRSFHLGCAVFIKGALSRVFVVLELCLNPFPTSWMVFLFLDLWRCTVAFQEESRAACTSMHTFQKKVMPWPHTWNELMAACQASSVKR